MRTLVLSLLLACSSFTVPAQTPPAPKPDAALPFALKPLGHGIYAAIDNAKGESGANAGFVVGDEGIAVIDTFENEPAAHALLGEIRMVSKLPIKFVINTHYHLDHVAGNAVFAKEGAVIVAHRNVPSWIHTENLKFFGKDITSEQKSQVENLAAPTMLYDSETELGLGSLALHVQYFPGHTGGDSVVIVQQEKSAIIFCGDLLEKSAIIFCGDLFWNHTLPNLIDASTLPWIETLSTFTKFAAVSPIQFIPGHGDPGNSADVAAFRGYLSDLREWVSAAKKEGDTGASLVDPVLPQMKKKYGSWHLFDYFSKRNIADVETELNSTKHIPSIQR